MVDDDAVAGCRLKVTAEFEVDVADPAALERAALAHIGGMVFALDDDSEEAQEQLRAAERDVVAGDSAAALSLLLDLDAVVDVDGVEVGGAEYSVEASGHSRPLSPDFAVLFEVCACGLPSCGRCAGIQVTSRTAAVLWSMAVRLADHAYDDVIEHGDDPVTTTAQWSLFAEFPRITWRQNAIWRRQAARSFDDLAEDLAAGRVPQPCCAAEEMALHLMLSYASDAVDDGRSVLENDLSALPKHTDDHDWDLLREVLFQDNDILELFDPSRDGIEDPDDEQNRYLRMGDYTAPAWFTPFDDPSTRDPRRPFRR
ncbi:hypothetical protein SK854_04355 [Lentzea sp. BCCO 10_0061]|uniref:Uncharacterized protein n=1 Tax=Lentzea sokolovensis TaxID=3095429 RepID=A0ABU4UQA2_9PSEU|nr:hypothetical protein [Lentzea sp. BCCO 10_0061]MDX8141332.1 hypothetical protein [Lentzea sp. BCCO 10_0061]